MKRPILAALPLAALALSACTVMPTAPTVMVLPGTGKSFEQFRYDEANCRQYALGQVGGQTANQAAASSGVSSAVVGTVVGAVAGAALGGDHRGAATGAGAGLLMGSAIGAGNAQSSAYGSQRAYDNAFVQCMYANGHRVPVYGNMVTRPAVPGSYGYPPPPPGYPAR